jgi:hypothetical protein
MRSRSSSNISEETFETVILRHIISSDDSREAICRTPWSQTELIAIQKSISLTNRWHAVCCKGKQ